MSKEKLNELDSQIKADIKTINAAEKAFDRELLKLQLTYPDIFGDIKPRKVLSPRKSKKGKK
jgi:hypothetical protein